MPVTGNQPQLVEAIQLWFERPPKLGGRAFRAWQQVEKGHGRLEKRILIASCELNG